MKMTKKCGECQGTGEVAWWRGPGKTDHEFRRCQTCHGFGVVVVEEEGPPLLAGGQGRNAEEIHDSGIILAVIAGAAVVMLAVWLLMMYGR